MKRTHKRDRFCAVFEEEIDWRASMHGTIDLDEIVSAYMLFAFCALYLNVFACVCVCLRNECVCARVYVHARVCALTHLSRS